MISDDFRCFPMFSAVFQCFPTVFQLFSDDVFRLLNSLQAELNYLWWVLSCSQDDISDHFRCFPMFLAVFRCFQLGCNYYRIAPCAMHNHPLCATFVELPLWSVAGSGCFGWISTWTKLDHVGNTGGHWETMSSSFSISFESSKSVYAFYIVFSPWYNWWIR